jgi:hypothetical protein
MLQATGIDWSKYKAEITAAITGVMESITTESPVKAPSQKGSVKRGADFEDQNGEAEEFEENSEEEEGEDDADSEEDEDEFTDEGDYTTPQWNALPAEVKARVMEVVWAKAPQEPWWPSLIYHPMNVSGKLKKDALKFCKAKYLVYFYAGGSTPWQYVPFAACEPFDPANLPADRLAPTQRGKPLGPKAKAHFDEAVELASSESRLDNKWDRAGWLVDEERAAEREARRAERAAARASNKPKDKKSKKRPSSKAPVKSTTNKKAKVESKTSNGGGGSSNGWLGATEEEIAAEEELALAASEAVASEQRQFASMAPFKALAEMPSDPEDEESEEESEVASDGDDDYDAQAAAKAKKKAAAAEKKVKDAAKKKRPRPDDAGAQVQNGKASAAKKLPSQPAATPASPRESLKAMAKDLATSLGAASADPSAVESAVTSPDTSEAAQAAVTKALKGLWKFDMTASLLPEAPIKLVKALKKKHPSAKVQQQAGAIFDKWAALGKSASTAATAVPNPATQASEGSKETASRPAPAPASEPESKPNAAAADNEASAPPAAAPKSEPVPHQAPEKPESAVSESKAAADPMSSTTAPATVVAAPTPAVVQPEPSQPVKPSKAPEAPAANEKGIDAKLREKVKAAMRMKEVPEAQVSAVESALFEASGGSERGDRGKFKELTRLLAKRLGDGNDAKAGLSSGALTPAALVAEIAAGK